MKLVFYKNIFEISIQHIIICSCMKPCKGVIFVDNILSVLQ